MDKKGDYNQWRQNQDSRSSSSGDSNESVNCPNPVGTNETDSGQVNRPATRSRSTRNRRGAQGAEVPIYVKRVHIIGQPITQSTDNLAASPDLAANQNTDGNLDVNNQNAVGLVDQQGSSTGVIVRNLKRRADNQNLNQLESQLDPQPQQSGSQFQYQPQPEPINQPQSQTQTQFQLQQQVDPQYQPLLMVAQPHLQQPQHQQQLQPQTQPHAQPQHQHQHQPQQQQQFQQQFQAQHQYQPLLMQVPQVAHHQIQSQVIQTQTPLQEPQEPQISPERMLLLHDQYQRQLISMERQRQHRIAQLQDQRQQQQQQQQLSNRVTEFRTVQQQQQQMSMAPPAPPPPPPPYAHTSHQYPIHRVTQPTFNDSSTQPKRRQLPNQSTNQQSDCFRTPDAPSRNSSIPSASMRSNTQQMIQPIPGQPPRRRSTSFEQPMTIQQPPRRMPNPNIPFNSIVNRMPTQHQHHQLRPQHPQQQISQQSQQRQPRNQPNPQPLEHCEAPIIIRSSGGPRVLGNNNGHLRGGHGNYNGNIRNNQRIQAEESNKLIDDPLEMQRVGNLYRRYSAPIERRNNDEPLDLSRSGQPIEPPNPQNEPPLDGQEGGGGDQGGEAAVNLSTSSSDSHIVDLSLNSSSSEKSVRLNGHHNGTVNGHHNEHSHPIGNPNNQINDQIGDQAIDQITDDTDSSSSSMSIPTSPPSSPSKLIA